VIQSANKKITVLAIAPHPDDLEIGCSGTLIKMANAGHDIHLLIMTKGEAGGNPEIRVREQVAAADFYSAKSITWGGFVDTEIPLKKGIEVLEETLARVLPDLVFAPWGKDTHQDHRNTSAQVRSATRYTQNVLFYEVSSTVDFLPDAFVDISTVLEDKFGSLRAHKSQVDKQNIGELSVIDCARSMAHFRGCQSRLRAAEGFKILRMRLAF
jgi:LmbE family N-acetylglucosaminyl deacetylase